MGSFFGWREGLAKLPAPPLSLFFPPFHPSKTSSDYARNLEIIQSGRNVAN